MQMPAINLEGINEKKIIDQIRCLGIDMIDNAHSGHPGIVLGAAPIIYTLYAHHMNIDVQNPDYFNRDRFIMSAGHGSALLYATLYMSGFPISLDDLKNFRKLSSITPGHPEYKITPGVDATTGPLGEGIAMGVGMAMAEANLRNRFKSKKDLINYYTYVLVSDGDLMEGVSYEAASLAGILKLNKLIVLYDSNNVCLDGKTNKTFNDNISMRFISLGWNVITVQDGENFSEIDKAITEAKNSSDKPTLIEIKTVIGKYSKLEGTNLVHGKPLTKEDLSSIKAKLEVRDIPFQVSQRAVDEMQALINSRCKKLNEKFLKNVDSLSSEEKNELEMFMSNDKTIDLKDFVYDIPESLEESPRDTSSKILNYIVNKNSLLIGGSADLFSANKTYINDGGDFSSENYLGKNIFFGVREHAMGAIANGLALSGFRPYISTFLSFSDFLKPAIRLGCMMKLPIVYIFTHDSISVGEDGPTHQPVEQLLGLRSIPNMEVFRPADANEVIGSYKTILEKINTPATISLSRNKLPILENTKANLVEKGGYVVLDTMKAPSAIVISCGEELHEVLKAAKDLLSKGIFIRVVSMPNLERFLRQDAEYIDSVLPVEIRKIAVEAEPDYLWNKIIFNSKNIISLNSFGMSASKDDIYKLFGFDYKSLEEKIENLLK